MSRQWMSSIKSRAKLPEVIERLGLIKARSSSFGPCPSCSADRRSGDDRRGPCGYGRGGWKCHVSGCDAKGDAIELISLVRFGNSTLSREQYGELREFCSREGWCDAPEERPRTKRAGLVKATTKSAGRSLRPGGGGARKRKEGGARRPRSSFSWRPEMAGECEATLWGETGTKALDYLLKIRGFTEETIKYFGLGCLVVSEDETWITTPLHQADGALVNVRFRRLPDADGETPKPKYRVCPGRDLPLFGVRDLGNDIGEEVIITEGEFDAMALWQYGFKVSVVSGTAGAGTFKAEWLDDLEPYRGFVLLYDDDDSGDAGAETAAEALGAYRCSRATLPENDANACLVAGVEVARIERAMDRAASMVGVEIKTVADFHAQLETLIENPQMLIGRSLGSEKLDEIFGGMRPGLWVFTGPSGHGKTTFTTWLCMGQARIGVPVALTSFEQQPIGTVQKLLRMELEQSFMDVTREERRRAIDALDEMPIYIIDHYGRMPLDTLVETIRFAIRRYGVKVFQVDHLHFLLDSSEDERKSIDAVVRTLALLSVDEGVTIILIAHPDKTHSREGRRVKLGDLKGSSAIEQDAHVGVVVQRAPLTKKRKYPAARIYLDKARSEFALPGSNRLIPFDPEALCYADSWYDTPMGRDQSSGTSSDTESEEGEEEEEGASEDQGGAEEGEDKES